MRVLFEAFLVPAIWISSFSQLWFVRFLLLQQTVVVSAKPFRKLGTYFLSNVQLEGDWGLFWHLVRKLEKLWVL